MCAAARRRLPASAGRQPLQPEATRECAGRNASERRANLVWGRPNRSRPCLDGARNCIWRNKAFLRLHGIERCSGRFAQHSLKFPTPERARLLFARFTMLNQPMQTRLEQSSVEAIGFRTAMCVRYSWMDHVGFNVAGAPAAHLAKNGLPLARALKIAVGVSARYGRERACVTNAPTVSAHTCGSHRHCSFRAPPRCGSIQASSVEYALSSIRPWLVLDKISSFGRAAEPATYLLEGRDARHARFA
jgi:hypothetical protein